ncbi:DMT family transporter [Clostridium hydrogeniformans]|uniref:DMT family transporter n=1 Tax=Clostridium hydrogeniformans TaxID=349933 RepID=UPI000488E00C|nr:DMT family transporter [Clostridium hydrogeniformans]
MLGLIFSIVAGIAMSLQGVFNTRLGEKVGSWETNLFVQGTGFLITIIVVMFFGKGDLKALKDANKLYLLGGVLGVIITITVMEGIKFMGPSYAIIIILIAQLTAAALIDAFGLFDSHKIIFGWTKIIGIAIMVLGIVIFKWKG